MPASVSGVSSCSRRACRLLVHQSMLLFHYFELANMARLHSEPYPTKCPWWLYSKLSLSNQFFFSSHFLVDFSCFQPRRFLRSRTRYRLENLSQPIHIDFEQFGTRSSHIQPCNLDFRTFGRFWLRSHIRAPDIILKVFCYQSEPISNAFGPFDRISNCSISLFRIFPSLGHIHQPWTIHFVSAGVVVLENVS